MHDTKRASKQDARFVTTIYLICDGISYISRLASAPVPFTVLSIVSNPCNEDYLAVTGLKDFFINF